MRRGATLAQGRHALRGLRASGGARTGLNTSCCLTLSLLAFAAMYSCCASAAHARTAGASGSASPLAATPPRARCAACARQPHG